MTTIEALATRYATIPGMSLVDPVTLFYGPKAERPDTDAGILTIHATGGPPPDGTQQELAALKYPTFQITARAAEYLDALALGNAAFALSSVANILLGDVFFLHIFPRQSEPFDLPLESGRARVAFNIETLRR